MSSSTAKFKLAVRECGTAMANGFCLQRFVVLREVRKQVLEKIKHLETLTHGFESQKWEGSIIGLNVLRRRLDREMRKIKAQYNVGAETPPTSDVRPPKTL